MPEDKDDLKKKQTLILEDKDLRSDEIKGETDIVVKRNIKLEIKSDE